MRQMPRSRYIAAGLCLALVVAFLVYVLLSKQVSEESRLQAVVAAKESIPARQVITGDMVMMKSFPRKQIPPGAAVSTEAVIGQVALQPIKKGDPISMGQLAPKGAALGLSYAVPEGMRAVTVALDPIIGVAGFLKPGDHVDVLATFEVGETSITKTVLQNVLLLATGSEIAQGKIEPGGKQAKAEAQPNATLAVTPTDAEKLILAESKGKLRLTLRPSGETSYVVSKGVTSRQLIGYVPPETTSRPPASQVSVSPAVQRSVLTGPPPIIRETSRAQLTPMLPPLRAESEKEVGKKVQVVRGTKIEEVVVPE